MNVLKKGHTPQSLSLSFAMHKQFEQTGDMRNVKWADLRQLTR